METTASIKKSNSKHIKHYDKYIVITVGIIASIFRIIITNMLGTSFCYGSRYDDLLLMQYANLRTHFLNPDVLSLVKTMSFSLFLNLPNLTGISYCLLISITWIFAGLVTVAVFKQLYDNKIFLLFVYLLTIFLPISFSGACTRLYRNAIIPQFVLIVFALIFYVVLYNIKDKMKFSIFVISNIFLGSVALFTAYIKEDGVWIYYCLLLSVIFNVIVSIIQYISSRKKKTTHLPKTILKVVILILPVAIFLCGVHIYKSVNYVAFGVYETNTRTEGELGQFCNNIYKIDSEDRTGDIWAPRDAIDKAFQASETLSQYPQLKTSIYSAKEQLQGYDENGNEIKGDFLGWCLRLALSDTGVWESEQQVSDLFKQINSEIDTAFSQGKLQEDSRFRLLSSTGGKTPEEISNLKDEVLRIFDSHININNYTLGGGTYSKPYADLENRYQESLATYLTGEYISLSIDDSQLSDEEKEKIDQYYGSNEAYDNRAELERFGNIGNAIIEVIFQIYSFINPGLFILSLIMSVATFVLLIIKKTRSKIKKGEVIFTVLVALFIVALFMLSVAYAFSISWFTTFVGQSGTVFYSVAVPSLLLLMELFGLYLFIFWIKTLTSPNIKDNKMSSRYAKRTAKE